MKFRPLLSFFYKYHLDKLNYYFHIEFIKENGFYFDNSRKFKNKKAEKMRKKYFCYLFTEKRDEADTYLIDTEISIKLPENTEVYLLTKFEGQEIIKVIGLTNGKKRLWINLLNESYLNKYYINKHDVIGYLVFESNNRPIHLDYAKNKKNSKKNRPPIDYLPKDCSKKWKNYFKKKKL